MVTPGLTAWRELHAATIRRLYASAAAARWELAEDSWAEALFASAAHRFPDGASASAVREYLESLHHADLALARACRDGHPAAWDQFVLECRPALYAAARAIAGEGGRDLADGLYAELFGLAERDGERRSLFAYFHGRSRLVTWLRSVLVQRQIDRHRSESRFDPLDADAADARMPPAPVGATEPHAGDFERRHFVRVTQAALDAAVASLQDRDRLRLRLYYGEDLTLAQIGRVTGESESTVSRKLERSRRDLRRLVEAALRAEHGLGAATIAECFEVAADAPELQLSRLLTRAEDG